MKKSVKSINPFKSVILTIYDISKVHGGELKVETKEREGLSAEAFAQVGTTFTILVPIV